MEQLPPNSINQLGQPQIPIQKKPISPVVIIVILIAILTIAVAVINFWQQSKSSALPPLSSQSSITPQEKGCTFDAKICPDGSSVGRVPPDCEFAPCPSVNPLLTPLASPTPTVSSQPQTQIPADWKTYSFTQGNPGFSLQYPSDKLKQILKACQVNESTYPQVVAATGITTFLIMPGKPCGSEFSLTISNNLEKLSPLEYWQDLFSNRPLCNDDVSQCNVIKQDEYGQKTTIIFKIEKIYLDYHSGLKIISESSTHDINIYVPYDPNQILEITYSSSLENDQILSTFKFLDSSTDGQFCGGIAGVACPKGYKCQLDGNYPDAGGKCVK